MKTIPELVKAKKDLEMDLSNLVSKFLKDNPEVQNIAVDFNLVELGIGERREQIAIPEFQVQIKL